MSWTNSSSTGWSLNFNGTYYTVTREELAKSGLEYKPKVYLKTTNWAQAHLLFDYLCDGYSLDDEAKLKELLGPYAPKRRRKK